MILNYPNICKTTKGCLAWNSKHLYYTNFDFLGYNKNLSGSKMVTTPKKCEGQLQFIDNF